MACSCYQFKEALKYLGKVRFPVQYLLIALLVANYCFGQKQYHFNQFDAKSGLSSNATNCAFTDSRGFTWIGTNSGLNCFDGTSFETFFHRQNDPASLPHSNIKCITQESDGTLLLATQLGVARFNVWNKKCSLVEFQSQDSADICTDLTQDRNGNIWCWSQHELFKLNRISGRLELVIKTDKQQGQPDRIAGLYTDRKSNVWLCTFNGLCLLDEKNRSVEVFRPLESDELLICAAYEDDDGNFWLGSWGNGFMRFFPETKTFESAQWEINPVYSGAANIVTGFAQTTDTRQQKTIWANTNNGLAQVWIDSSTGKIRYRFFPHSDSDPTSPASNFIGTMHVNESDQLWLPTDHGLSVLLPEVQAFQTFAPEIQGMITQVVRDDDGFWICTWHGNGLQKIDRNGNIIQTWKRVPENATSADYSQISDLSYGENGRIWVATYGGLIYSDDRGRTFQEVEDIFKGEYTHPNHFTSVIEVNGYPWCGTYKNGIAVYDPDNLQFSFVRNSDNDEGGVIPANLVWCLFDDGNEDKWIATNNGVVHYHLNQRENFTEIVTANGTVDLTVCSNIYQDSQLNIWICTDDGLACHRNATGKWDFYDRETGLAGNDVEDVQEDNDGNLWISTDNGLSVMKQDGSVIANFNASSGLPAVALGLLFRIDDDMVVTAGGQMVRFTPSLLITKRTQPKIYITSVKVGNTILNLESNPTQTDSLQLNADQNSISFEFVSPGLFSGAEIQYEYQLLGASDEWISVGTRKYATFAELAPGHYEINIRASFKNGATSELAKYGFTIRPPFWQTWWFISGVVIFVLLATILVVRRESTRKMRVQLLRMEKQQAIEKERNRISKDMHDDLGSGLTTIAIMSEVVKQKLSSGDNPKQQVDTISDSARNLVDNLNEIIWALNPGNDNLRNLIAYIREYATNYLEQFEINIRCTIPDEIPSIPLSENSRRFLFLVIKESLHNVVKHSKASEVVLAIQIEKRVVITISDNGVGFDTKSVRENGNGLKNMQQRMESIGGSYFVSSEKGTITRLELPLT